MMFIYFNLHKRVFSIKDKATGRVVGHCERIAIVNPEFRVSEAGRKRVLRERVKNVHAGVQGVIDPEWSDWSEQGKRLVRYDPYKAGHFFFEDETPIHRAKMAVMVVKDGSPRVYAAT